MQAVRPDLDGPEFALPARRRRRAGRGRSGGGRRGDVVQLSFSDRNLAPEEVSQGFEVCRRILAEKGRSA